MATNTQRIGQLERVVNGLSSNEKALEVRLERLDEADTRSESTAIALRDELDRLRKKAVETEQRLALVEANVKELKTATDKWGQRLWQLFAALGIAALSWFAGRLTKP